MLDYLKNLLDKFIDGVGNVIFAILILVVALIVANIVKSLVVKGLTKLKLDEKLTKFGMDAKNGIALIAKIVWFVVFLLFVPAVFSQLGMTSITAPISNLVSSMLNFIPNIIAAGILIAVGVILGDIVKQISKPVLKATKVDLLQAKFGIRATEKTALSSIIAEILKVLIIIFFVLQAISALNMSTLNSVGHAIISYIPSLIASLLIACAAFFGGSAIEKVIVKANPKMKGFALISKVVVYVVAVFMILSQLGIATTIVNKAFEILLLGISIAIAIAFGIGGRDFAKHTLDKLEKKIDDNN